jgi:hypothetical protein
MLVFCFCPTDTRITFYECSYLYPLDATNAPNGVLAIPDEILDVLITAGKVRVREETLEQGGG